MFYKIAENYLGIDILVYRISTFQGVFICIKKKSTWLYTAQTVLKLGIHVLYLLKMYILMQPFLLQKLNTLYTLLMMPL